MPNVSKRPGTVIFVAIVLFVFGGYCFLNAGSTCWYAAHIAANPEAPDLKAKVRFDDVEANLRFVAHEIPGKLATIAGFAVLDILFSIALLAGGVGVLRLAPAARKATIVIVLAGLFYMVAHDVFSLLVVVPAEIRFLELHPPELPQAAAQDLKLFTTIMQIGIYAGTFVTLLVQVLIVALVVWLLNTATTKAAFGGPQTPMPPGEASPSAQPPKAPSIYSGYEDDEAQPA
jgi:hypothetical protein